MSEVLETLLVLFKGESGQLETTLKRIERETAETGGKVRKSLDFGQIGASLGGLAGGGGILAFLRSAAQESARTEAATRSFENAVKRQNVSLDDAGAVVERLAGRFGLLETDVQEAASILIKSGLDLKTVEDSLTAVGASAASAGFDIATGMKNGAVGIAFGRSEVLETSGVIVNASQGWKTYADSSRCKSNDAELSDQRKSAKLTPWPMIREAKPAMWKTLIPTLHGDFAQSASLSAGRELKPSFGTTIRSAVLQQEVCWAAE